MEYIVLLTALSKSIAEPLVAKLVAAGCQVRVAGADKKLSISSENEPSCLIAIGVIKDDIKSSMDMHKFVVDIIQGMSAKYYSLLVFPMTSDSAWSNGNIDMRDVKTYPASKNEEKKDKAN